MDTLLLVKAAVLGVIEGLSEFLPISSTGHLLVAERFLGFSDPGEVFTVVIQLPAILAVVWLFRERIWRLCRGLAGDPVQRRFAGMLILATLPAALIGYPLDKFLEAHLYTGPIVPAVVAATWAVGGLAILAIEGRRREPRISDSNDLTVRVALIIGACQILAAAFPGTSRSGATIMGALLLGVSRPVATDFSFWLAIPVMLGASLLKLAKHHHEIHSDRIGAIAVGSLVSFVVALVVVRWLIGYVATRDFKPFAWYRLATGLILAAILAAGLLPAAVD